MNDDTDQPAGTIIAAFGGIRPMATRLEVPVSTVQGWKQRDTIPAARMAAVRAAAEAAGIDLSGSAGTTPAVIDVSAYTTADDTTSDENASDNDASAGDAPAERPAPSGPQAPGPEENPPVRSGAGGGGVAILALVIAVGVGGWVWWSTMGPGASGGDNARLSALEGRIARLSEASAGGTESPALEALARDVAALRDRLSDATPPDVEAVLAPMRAEIDTLRAALATRGAEGGAAVDPEIPVRLDALATEIQNAVQLAATNMQALSGSFVAFENRLKALADAQAEARALIETRIAALEAGRSAEEVAVSRASALALAAGQIRTALERGAPYAEPLAILDSLRDGDAELDAAVARLRATAETGATTGAALELSFGALVPDLLAASRSGASDDLVDRLTDRINDIISIRRTGA
ncbi:MAG: hypothetical protein VW516_11890, partial [Rhodospirillaceae bacterium]